MTVAIGEVLGVFYYDIQFRDHETVTAFNLKYEKYDQLDPARDYRDYIRYGFVTEDHQRVLLYIGSGPHSESIIWIDCVGKYQVTANLLEYIQNYNCFTGDYPDYVLDYELDNYDSIKNNTSSQYSPYNVDKVKERLSEITTYFGVLGKNSTIPYNLTPEYQKQLDNAREIIRSSDIPYDNVNADYETGALVISFKSHAISDVYIPKIEQLIDVPYYVELFLPVDFPLELIPFE